MATKIELVVETLYKNRDVANKVIADIQKIGSASAEAGLKQSLLGEASSLLNQRYAALSKAVLGGTMSIQDATKAAGVAKSEFDALAGALKDTPTKVSSLSEKFAALKSALLPAVGAIVAVGAALKKAFEFAAEGAMIELTTQRFDTLARSIGTVGTALTIELKAATQGAASNLELMAGASRLMAMGLVQGKDQLSDMLGMISRLKEPTLNLSSAIENFSLLIANRSILRLDSFNISGARTKQILDEMGVASAQAATDAEFLAAVMQAGQESMDRMGVSAGNTTTAFVTLGAAWKDLIDEIKRDAAQGDVAGSIGGLLGTASLQLQKMTLEKQLADLGIGIADIARESRAMGVGWHTLGNSAQANAVKVSILTEILREQALNQAMVNSALEDARSQSDDLSGSYDAQAVALERVAAARDDDNVALRLAHDLFAKANPLFAKDNEILRDREQVLRAAADAEAAHTAQLERMAASEAAAHARALELNAAMQERRSLMEQELTKGKEVSPLAQQIFDLGEAAGAGAQAVGALLIATGQFSEAAVEQAVKAAILKQALDDIIAAFFAGETSAKTAADAIKVWQQSINDMSVQEALQKLGTLKATLDALPRNIPITVTVTVDDATGAITWNRNGQTTQSNAGGTSFFPGGWSWVGEQGPELVQMPRGTQIMSNPQSMNHAAQVGGNYTFNVSVTGNTNRQDFKRIVKNEISPLLDRRDELAAARRRS